MRKGDRKNNPRIIEGLIILGISLFLALVLLGTFGKSGSTLAGFFVGVFGFSLYGYTLAGFVFAIMYLCKQHIRNSKSHILASLLTLFLIVMTFHVLSSKEFVVNASYGSYIKMCYSSANTAGGVFAAIIAYPFMKLNYVFALVLFSTLFFLSLFFLIWLEFYKGKGFSFGNGKKNVKHITNPKNPQVVDLSAADNSNIKISSVPEVLFNENIAGTKQKEKLEKRFSKTDVGYSSIESAKLDSTANVKEGKQHLGIENQNDDVVLDQPLRDNPKRRSIDLLYGNGTLNKGVDGGKGLSVEDISPEQNPREKAINKLYNNAVNGEARQVPSNNKLDKKDLYASYTNNSRREQIVNNLLKNKRSQQGEQSDNQEFVGENAIDNFADMGQAEKGRDIFDDINALIGGDKILRPDNSIKPQPNENAGKTSDFNDLQKQQNTSEIAKQNNELKQNPEIIKLNSDAIKGKNSEMQNGTTDGEGLKNFDERKNLADKSKFVLDENVVDKTMKDSNPLLGFETSNKNDTTDFGRKPRSDKGGTHFIINDAKNSNANNEKDLKNNLDKVSTTSGGNNFGRGNVNTVNDRTNETNSPFLRQQQNNRQTEKSIDEAPAALVPYRVPKSNRPYIAPPIELLNEYQSAAPMNIDYAKTVEVLETTLESFGINATVVAHMRGPAFTRFELQMPPGVPVKKVPAVADDLAMRLAVSTVRILAPVPGKSVVGVEIPNEITDTVGLKDILRSPEFNQSTKPLTFALGKDLEGNCHVGHLTKMPHLLIAGATGSGKSVGINALLCSILYKYTPDEVKMILIDPKRVELSIYSGLPHLIIKDVIFKNEQVLNSLDWAIHEMEMRYTLFLNNGVQNIGDYNALATQEKKDKLPFIVIVIDELAELIMVLKKELEDRIQRLTQLARAAGIHVVIATQRPSVNVVTGVIKSNIPSRIAFQVSSNADSRTILDSIGAEDLLGNGDMLFAPSYLNSTVRLQGAFVSGKELRAVCDYIKNHNDSIFDEETTNIIMTEKKEAEQEFNKNDLINESDDQNPVFIEALRLAVEEGSISISKIQRKLAVGYPRAGKIIDLMESRGYIEKNTGSSKPRKTLLSMNEFLQLYGDNRAGRYDDEE